MPLKLKGLDVLDAWLATDPPEREVVLAWLFKLAENPDGVEEMAVPVMMGLPRWTVIVPETMVAVTYTVVKHPPYAEDAAGIFLRRIERLA